MPRCRDSRFGSLFERNGKWGKNMSYRVIVVGGGIIGTSIAYYLTKLGVEVTLIEAKDLASGTSGACDRAIMLQSKKPGPLLDLAIESAHMYADLEAELGADLEYRKCGGMILVETEQEREAIQRLVDQQQKAGLQVELLSGTEARKRQQGLSEDIIGATWSDDDAEVNPLNVCFAMASAARKRGADIRLQSRVTGLITDRERVVGVEVSGEKIFADATVLSSGVWTPKLLAPLGLHVPIIPRRGQILVSERIPPMINSVILSGAYIASKMLKRASSGEKTDPAGIGLAIGQTKSGNLLIGGSREFVGFDRRPTAEVLHAISQTAVRVFPVLGSVNILRAFAGLRPYTPDKMPILGVVKEWSGLYIAAGHEGDGIALAPVTGKLMARVACGLDPGFDLRPFSLSRFQR